MKWVVLAVLLSVGALMAKGDELHLRDGSVIQGVYAGGTQDMVYFQRTPVGPEMYPLYSVESVKFRTAASIAAPHASFRDRRPVPGSGPAGPAANLATRLKWVFALFFPPHPPVQLAASAH